MPNSHSTLEIPRTKKKPKLNIMSELVPGLSSGVALAASLIRRSVHPSAHTRLAVASCCVPLCYVTFLKGSERESPAGGGGLPRGRGPLTSLASQSVPQVPPAGCPCHSLTDRYKVTAVCSEVPCHSAVPGQCPTVPPA